MAPIFCTVCHDQVTLGGEVLPTGPICADCAALREAHILFGNPDAPKPEGVITISSESVPEGQPDLHADQANTFGPLMFQPPKYAKQLSLSVEEWFYLGPHVVSTPYELHLAGKFLTMMVTAHRHETRFVVVLSWQSADDQTAPWREVGPSFTVFDETPNARAQALVEATANARAQAKRLKAVGPFGFVPARQINN